METPTEMEFGSDQEEDLRGEEVPMLLPKQPTVAKPPVPLYRTGSTATTDSKIQQNLQLQRVKTRIQQEIQEVTQREKELLAAGKIQTTSMDAVDSKVIRIGEMSEGDGAVLGHIKDIQKSDSAPQISIAGRTFKFPIPSIRRLLPKSGKKGIMERILATGGRRTCISSFTSSSSSSSAKYYLPLPVTDNFQVSKDDKPTVSSTSLIGEGSMSAKKNIQEELKQLKVKEEELRLQKTGTMVQSQPNTLDIMDKPEERSPQNGDDNKHMPSLESSFSNPNLLDLDDDKSVKDEDFSQNLLAQEKVNKTRALIAHWESKIQQNTDQ